MEGIGGSRNEGRFTSVTTLVPSSSDVAETMAIAEGYSKQREKQMNGRKVRQLKRRTNELSLHNCRQHY